MSEEYITNNTKVILICEDDFDGILSAVYDAYMYPGRQVSIQVGEAYNYQLFCEYQVVEKDIVKAGKVFRTLEEKTNDDFVECVYHLAMSRHERKGTLILGLILLGLEKGGKVIYELTNPLVQECYDVQKTVKNETHFYIEILRFEEKAGRILVAKIEPKQNVMHGVMEHFSDRFPEENFLICDMNRKLCGIHEKGQHWFVRENFQLDEWLKLWEQRVSEERSVAQVDQYIDLWKVFFRSIAIKERENEKCQKTHVPLRYRKYMTEFSTY